MKKVFLILALFASLGLDAQFVITSSNNVTEDQDGGIFYYLPRNIIKLEFTVEETTYHIGPYAEFADKLMGMTDYVRENKTVFSIKDVDIQIGNEADPNAVYCISVDDRSKEPMPSVILDENGIILAMGYDSVPTDIKAKTNRFIYSELYQTSKPEVTFIGFLDNEIEVEEAEESDEDGEEGGKKAPKQLTKEDRAKAIVDKITKIRNAYFELVSGFQEVAYGTGTAYMAENMQNLENEYISLFKGKITTSTYKKTVYYTPEANNANNSVTVAKLSVTDGIVDANGKGDAIKIQFESINSLQNVNPMIDKGKKTSFSNKLFYRMPAKSNVKVVLSNNVIAEKQLTISQFGKIRSLSVKNNKVLFNPNTGQIITLIKQDNVVKN